MNFPLPISNLQLGLIIGGVLLVLGVIIYNHWQERRVRRRIESAFRPTEEKESARVDAVTGLRKWLCGPRGSSPRRPLRADR